MSDAEGAPISVSGDGIRVEKSVDTETFEFPAVVIEIRAERDEPAVLRLTDPAPEEFTAADVGFHPDHGAEHWTFDSGDLIFEREMGAEESYTTVYGFRGLDGDSHEALDGSPVLDVAPAPANPARGGEAAVDSDDPADGSVEGATENGTADAGSDAGELDRLAEMYTTDSVGEESEGITPRNGSEAVRDVIEGRRDTLGPEPAPEAAETAAGDEDADAVEEEQAAPDEQPEPDTGESGSVAEADDAAGAGPEADAGADVPEGGTARANGASPAATVDEPETAVGETPPDGGAEETEHPVGGVARVLAKELRESNVSEADRDLLCEELIDTDRSTEARVQHLQTRVSDLEAYTDALEAFIDGNGTVQELIDDTEARMDGLDDRLAAVEGELEAVGRSVSDVEATVDGLDEDLTAVRDGIDRLEERLEEQDDRLDSQGGRLDSQTDRIEGIEAEVAAVDDRLSGIDDLGGTVDDLESDLEAIREDVREVEAFGDRLRDALSGLVGDIEPVDSEE